MVQQKSPTCSARLEHHPGNGRNLKRTISTGVVAGANRWRLWCREGCTTGKIDWLMPCAGNTACETQMLDGGYYDNSGLITIAQLWPALLDLVRVHNKDKSHAPIAPVIVSIDSHYQNEKAGPVKPLPGIRTRRNICDSITGERTSRTDCAGCPSLGLSEFMFRGDQARSVPGADSTSRMGIVECYSDRSSRRCCPTVSTLRHYWQSILAEAIPVLARAAGSKRVTVPAGSVRRAFRIRVPRPRRHVDLRFGWGMPPSMRWRNHERTLRWIPNRLPASLRLWRT